MVWSSSTTLKPNCAPKVDLLHQLYVFNRFQQIVPSWFSSHILYLLVILFILTVGSANQIFHYPYPMEMLIQIQARKQVNCPPYFLSTHLCASFLYQMREPRLGESKVLLYQPVFYHAANAALSNATCRCRFY